MFLRLKDYIELKLFLNIILVIKSLLSDVTMLKFYVLHPNN